MARVIVSFALLVVLFGNTASADTGAPEPLPATALVACAQIVPTAPAVVGIRSSAAKRHLHRLGRVVTYVIAQTLAADE